MRRLYLLVAMIGLAVAGIALEEPAAYANQSLAPVVPSYPGDFPDPSVVWDAATASYWAYSTQSGFTNIQVMSGTVAGTWSIPSEALYRLPSWATWGYTWAPSVEKIGGRWVMWYATRDSASGRQCLSVATAAEPGGPFVDRSTAPAICQLGDEGSIDANIFLDGATDYLIWKSEDNAVGAPTHIWASALAPDGTSVVGSWREILNEDASWQNPVVEGPTMVTNRGTYYLFYGAENWDSSSAGIGYATCAGPLGPCVDRSTSGPWLSSQGLAIGPSGPDVFTDATGTTRLAYHAWFGCVGYPRCNRALWIADLSFDNGAPVLTG